MPPTDKEEALTEDETFDMNSFVADLLVQEEEANQEESSEESSDDDVADEEEGPDSEESGELSDEEDGISDEEEQVEEVDEDELSQGEQPPAEATVDPRDIEIERLKILAQNQNQQLIDILERQVALNHEKQETEQFPAIRDEVAKLALFGGDEEAWKALSSTERAEGTKFAADYMARVTRHAKDPRTLYADDIQTHVQREIQAAIAPLLQNTHKVRGQDIIDRCAKDLLENHRGRLLEVFNELPGSRSNDWGDLEASLKAAAKLVRNEVTKQDLETRERKIEVSNRQKKANKEAANRTGRRGSRRPPKNKNKAGWNPVQMTLAERAQQLQDKE